MESVSASGLRTLFSFGEESIVFSKKSTGAFSVSAKNTPIITGDKEAVSLLPISLVTSRLQAKRTIATIDDKSKSFFTQKVLTKRKVCDNILKHDGNAPLAQ